MNDLTIIKQLKKIGSEVLQKPALRLYSPLGAIKKYMDENIIIASHHEAGHAVMDYVVGWNIKSINLVAHNEKLKKGITNYDFIEDNQANQVNLSRRILALMGGPLAESLYRGEKQISLDLLGIDGIRIYELLKDDVNKDDTIQTALNQTATFLNFPMCKAAIDEIASLLIETYYLYKDKFNKIMTKHKVPQMNF